jgi:NTP pyrophosphatase (non-canonical NTP hydrolase)
MLDVIQRIYELQPRERKTMVELGLKLSEEVGELSEAILCSQNSPGCNYKELPRGKVLEEGSDVLLVTLTILFRAGYKPEEVAVELE